MSPGLQRSISHYPKKSFILKFLKLKNILKLILSVLCKKVYKLKLWNPYNFKAILTGIQCHIRTKFQTISKIFEHFRAIIALQLESNSVRLNKLKSVRKKYNSDLIDSFFFFANSLSSHTLN